MKNDDIVKQSINQTRQALIRSDLALFVIDGRFGIHPNDLKIAKWLNFHIKNQNEDNSNPKIIKNDENFYKNLQKLKENQEIKIPPIFLIANKIENDYYPDDVYNEYHKLGLGDPIFISAEHGDNLHELYKLIQDNIPEEYKQKYFERLSKRIQRYNEYKEKLKQDYFDFISKKTNNEDEIESKLITWEKDFDYINGRNVEENSDYDSDNDIDPLENLNMTKEELEKNRMLKKPISIAFVGQTNVGKSSIVNTLLKENRVIISDVPNTTRDAIPIEWIYKGRRIVLIDTAGIQQRNKVNDRVDKLISASTINSIKFCQVIVYVIDSMNAFSSLDIVKI